MSAPIFVVVKTNGEIWIANDAPTANAIGGVVHKVSPEIRSQKIATANGATSVTSASKSGAQTDISN